MSCKIKTLGSCSGSTLIGEGGTDNLQRLFPDADNSERVLWDSIAQEPAVLSGVTIRLWSLRRAMNRHPLYGEPANPENNGEWSFGGPWEMNASIEFEESENVDHEATSEGSQKTGEATMFIARKELEDIGAPRPKMGDVISMWGELPFSSQYKYWDVISADEAGHIMSTNAFVQYKLKLKHRTKFEPGRKVEGEKL